MFTFFLQNDEGDVRHTKLLMNLYSTFTSPSLLDFSIFEYLLQLLFKSQLSQHNHFLKFLHFFWINDGRQFNLLANINLWILENIFPALVQARSIHFAQTYISAYKEISDTGRRLKDFQVILATLLVPLTATSRIIRSAAVSCIHAIHEHQLFAEKFITASSPQLPVEFVWGIESTKSRSFYGSHMGMNSFWSITQIWKIFQ